MRKLNKKQKAMLDDWYERNKHFGDIGISWEMKDLPYGLYVDLEEAGDFETIYQAVTNYITEKL